MKQTVGVVRWNDSGPDVVSDVILELLLWIDAERWRYWFLAWASFAFSAALAWPLPCFRRWSTRWQNLAFCFSLLVTLVAFRWPGWFDPVDLNPDEAQVIASALTLERFPVYWKHVDGTTHGPLCELPLVLASMAGAPYSYMTARVIAVLLQALSLIAVYATVRCLADERSAKCGVLPGLLFWASSTHHDFTHYSTELPGIALLSVAGWLVATLWVEKAGSRGAGLRAYTAGFCLGAAPFAKLQSSPHAFALGLIAVGVVVWRARSPESGFRRANLGWLLAGAFSLPAIVAAHLTTYGLWAQFHYAYIESSVAYAANSDRALAAMPSHFWSMVPLDYSFAWFFFGAIAYSLAAAHRLRSACLRLRVAVWVGLGLFLAAYLTVLMPRREVAHYLHLLVIPTSLVLGLMFAVAADGSGDWRTRVRGFFCFLLITAVPQLQFRAVSVHPDLGELSGRLASPPSEAARFLIGHAQHGDTMAMWGWEPSLHVATGLPHATRDAHTAMQLADNPLREFYRTRYLRDIARSMPPWFVDAAGPGAFVFDNRTYFGYETFDELAEFIDRHYAFVAEFDNLRVYKRTDEGDSPTR